MIKSLALVGDLKYGYLQGKELSQDHEQKQVAKHYFHSDYCRKPNCVLGPRKPVPLGRYLQTVGLNGMTKRRSGLSQVTSINLDGIYKDLSPEK